MRSALLLALTVVVSPDAGDLKGPRLKYDAMGVVLDGHRTPWKDVTSITETDPTGEAPKLEGPDFDALVADPFAKEALKRVLPILEKRPTATALRPPFEGRWKAIVDSTGHHRAKAFALFAIDFAACDEKGRIYGGTGRALADYPGFDQPVLAAADGKVVQVEDRFDDLIPPKLGKPDEANSVTLRHSDAEHTFYAHLRKGSATVRRGDKVAKGQALARVGNSGASGMPHLHFALLVPNRTGWLSVPWRLHDLKLAEASGSACSVDVKQARPREGWIVVAPKP